MTRTRRYPWSPAAPWLPVLLALTLPAPLAADEIRVRGSVLRGTVKEVTATGVVFTPAAAKGELTIEYADLEDIRTDAPLHVIHGRDAVTVAPLAGYRNGRLLLGDTSVPVDTITWSVTQERYDESLMVRLRQGLRFWTGNFDLGFSYAEATINTSQLLVGLGAIRTEGPLKLTFGANSRYGTQDPRGAPKTTNQNDVRGTVRGDYAFTDAIFGFAAGDGLYDAIQRVSIRSVPRGGLGYKLYHSKTAGLQFEGGAGYTYQRYFGGRTDNYATAVFGVEAFRALPRDARATFRTDYLPAFGDWANDYLIRTEAALLIPFWDPFALKFSLLNDYDSTPAAGTRYNSLALSAGVSIVM